MKNKSLAQLTSEFQQTEVERVLDLCRGDTVLAARTLGISVATLYRKRLPVPTEFSARKAQVYLIRNPRADAIKIGYSTSPTLRESVMHAQDPELELIASYPGSKMDEGDLHRMFAAKRIRGEWFKLDAKDLREIAAFFALPA